MSQVTDGEDFDDANALKLLSAVRSGGQDDLLRRLTIAEKILPWLRWLVAGIVGVIALIVHSEIKLARVEDNSDSIKMNHELVESANNRITSLEIFQKSIDVRKSNYDLTVAPRIAVWDATTEEYKAFSRGNDSDLAHLREMWWMKQHGITNNQSRDIPFQKTP